MLLLLKQRRDVFINFKEKENKTLPIYDILNYHNVNLINIFNAQNKLLSR